MKIKTPHQVLMTLICALLMLPVFGQDTGAPVLYFVEDFQVKPSKVAEFREALNAYLKLYRENNVEYAWSTYQTEDFHFYFTVQMKNYEDVGKYFSASNEMTLKMEKEEIDKLNKLAYESTDNYHFELFYARSDLSYLPENYTDNPQESAYLQLSWFYIHPEKQLEMEAIAAKWVQVYNEADISMPYFCWIGHIGSDLPLYLYVFVGKNQEDFQNGMAEINEKLWEKTADLRSQTFDLVKRTEVKRGWYLPELSYIPEVNQ